MLRNLSKLRATVEYSELCRAWEAETYETDSWKDMVERAEAAEAECERLRKGIGEVAEFLETVATENEEIAAMNSLKALVR